MCEAVVYLKDESGLNLKMRDAASVRSEGGRIVCTDILGGSVALDGVRLVELDLLRHRVILERV